MRMAGAPGRTFATIELADEFRLSRDHLARIIQHVIGAGLTGASTALHLAANGVGVVLLERAQPAQAASGRNAGHVAPFLVGPTRKLARWPDRGVRLVSHFAAQRNIVFETCERFGIDGDAARVGYLEITRSSSARSALLRKADEWRPHGYEVELLEGDELRKLTGTSLYRYGLYWSDGGRVNPYLFTTGMAAAAVRHGARVYGDSAVLSCDAVGTRWRVRTSGGSVVADSVVLCTNGHSGNPMFASLTRTNYPCVACALATRPLSPRLLDVINPSRAAIEQLPASLFPLIVDGRNRLITATVPMAGRAHRADVHFGYLLRYLHRAYPETRDETVELESYWTGVTASSSSDYQADYPRLYRLERNVMAIANLGTWGNVMGPLLGRNVADALASGREDRLVLTPERPEPVRAPWLVSFRIRRVLMPLARAADRLRLV